MYDKIVFFNHGHLGDTLIAKHFISEIKKLIPSKTYAIANFYDYNYIYDIVDEHINLNSIGIGPDVWYALSEDGKVLYFNTWYGILHQFSHLDRIGVASDSVNNFRYNDGVLYNWENYIFYLSLTLQLIDEKLNLYHMLNEKLKFVLPLIEMENVHVPFINDDVVKILIYNQVATSGQADNVDFTPYIDKLLAENPNVIVYTSQPTKLSNKFNNLIELSEYITHPDLFKMAYLSTKCEYICGPGNAPIQLTWVSDNLSNFDKTYIVINRNNVGEAMLLRETNCKNIIVSGTEELFKELQSNLN